MHRYDDPARTIRARVGEAFAIALAGNPTTGYTWQPDADADYLELVGQEFERGGQGVGAGGEEVFSFRTLAGGETEVTFQYQRPWDRESRDTKYFRVLIS
jgi:predicted secreted protein